MSTIIDRHKVLFIIFGIILIIAIALIVKNKNLIGSFLGMGQGSSTPTPTIKVDYSNLAQVLSASSLVRDLPKNALFSLKFYNFNTGEREWEKSYIIKKGEVKEGEAEGADITFTLHSRYLKSLTNKNFCSIIKTARSNGELGIQKEISSAKFLWKYRGMLKYRECFGF